MATKVLILRAHNPARSVLSDRTAQMPEPPIAKRREAGLGRSSFDIPGV